MTKNNDLLKEFISLVDAKYMNVESANKLNLTDEAVGLESWAREIAGIIWKIKFTSSNLFVANADSFDMSGGDMAIQVTSDLSSTKIKSSIKTFDEKAHHKKFPKLYFFLLGERPKYQEETFKEVSFPFDKDKNIIGKTQLYRHVQALDNVIELENVLEITQNYFSDYRNVTMFDRYTLAKDATGYKQEIIVMMERSQEALLEAERHAMKFEMSNDDAVFLDGLKKTVGIFASANRSFTHLINKIQSASPAELSALSRLMLDTYVACLDGETILKALLPRILRTWHLAGTIAGLEKNQLDIRNGEAGIAKVQQELDTAEFAIRFLSP
ncbi:MULTISPECIES: SMEK domain-containing protein [unclassified Massilia]|uniref:SMEK domain-containing protein n=1 Tax=unclassified Massilia TaxID=2609279 RepID=UPI00177F3831|nr:MULTISPECIES: SMEK domain-containing protein [unclassified Massilia]MBD8530369.1 SMEK domain-containing protein [Massilia sp. CFBP 13647]MBD8673146.1 SMEK domain-containing protein [Massilia sp. CFBP 13721]